MTLTAITHAPFSLVPTGVVRAQAAVMVAAQKQHNSNNKN
jgi:hypothetical protein